MLNSMRLSERTISQLSDIVTGNAKHSGYRSGPQLVTLFNDVGYNDTYGPGFPSRGTYAVTQIRGLNDTQGLVALVELVFDPLSYVSGDMTLEETVDGLQPYLKRDGFELVWDGGRYRVRDLAGISVSVIGIESNDTITHEFIQQQLRKCDEKVQAGDFDGAITNARSLTEAVLKDVEQRATGACEAYGGDLTKLFRRVQRSLRLDPSAPGLSDAERQLLSGLTSVVNGLAAMRNELSDAHAVTRTATRLHAQLAVNAAKTVCAFVNEATVATTT